MQIKIKQEIKVSFEQKDTGDGLTGNYIIHEKINTVENNPSQGDIELFKDLSRNKEKRNEYAEYYLDEFLNEKGISKGETNFEYDIKFDIEIIDEKEE